MKIIGRVGGDYLISATEHEVARIAGFDWPGGGDFQRAMKAIGALRTNGNGRSELVDGVEIPVDTIFQRLTAIRANEKAVKSAAASLRALADLMDGKLPSIVAPSQPEDSPDADNEAQTNG